MLWTNSVPGERCPASQQEGLKLEHSSDLSTNVTGECSLHQPLHTSWSSLCFSSPAFPLVSRRFQSNPPTEPHEDVGHQEDPQPQGATHLAAGGCPADPTDSVKDSGRPLEFILTSATPPATLDVRPKPRASLEAVLGTLLPKVYLLSTAGLAV